MTVTRVNAPSVTVRRPAVVPPARASQPSPAAKPLARTTAAESPKRFSDLESYKKHVEASPVINLPAVREQAKQAEARYAAAVAALKSQQEALGQPALAQAVEAAKQHLEAATYPHRPQADELRAEADQALKQSGEISRQIMTLQQKIARAEGNKAARDRDFWGDDDYDGWDAVGDLLGSVGDSGTIRSAKAKIKTLIDEKVALEQKMLTLTAQAAVLDQKIGDPQAIAAATSALKKAEATLGSVESQLQGEQRRLTQAGAERDESQAKLQELETLKSELLDYRAHFGFVDRVKMLFSNPGWKKELNAFWKSKNL